MTGFAVFFLFGFASLLAGGTLVISFTAQYQRFVELFLAPSVAVPSTPPRLSSVRVRMVPARMPKPHRLPAAA